MHSKESQLPFEKLNWLSWKETINILLIGTAGENDFRVKALQSEGIT